MSNSQLTIEERIEVLKSIGEEIQGEKDLEELLRWCDAQGRRFQSYNGFEPSGRMHIAQALITAINTNKLSKAGGKIILYIADYFAQLNHKMGGDINKIKRVGEYFIEVFKASGMDTTNVEFVWASDFIQENKERYFRILNDIQSKVSFLRLKRTLTIMGRSEKDSISVSQLLYPCMQTTDVFTLGGENGVDITQLGNDQRKVNMLARELAPGFGRKPPIVISHHMLMGLKGKEKKMSKSDPDNAIFIEDEREDIFRKIHAAACPLEKAENPLFEYVKYIILPIKNKIEIDGHSYTTADEVADAFIFEGVDESKITLLKDAIAEEVDSLIQPVRDHFSIPENFQLLQDVIKYRSEQ
jgi:tyrosyl-tRNA synthetase